VLKHRAGRERVAIGAKRVNERPDGRESADFVDAVAAVESL
jgi:hypothetical protein